MKYLFHIVAILIISTQSLDVSKVRLAYKEAAHDKTKVEAFNKLLANVTKKDDVALVAYKGASIALKAKYAKTLKEKKGGFIEGVGYIDYAIQKEPNKIEPRFIRIGIQENTPKILKYKGNIAEDKTFILNQFSYINSANLKAHIKDYILQSTLFSETEKEAIKTQ